MSVFFHPWFSELEGSGSPLSHILPQQCLQLTRQTQVAELRRFYLYDGVAGWKGYTKAKTL